MERRTVGRTPDRRSKPHAGEPRGTFAALFAEIAAPDSSERRENGGMAAPVEVRAQESVPAGFGGGTAQLREEYEEVRLAGQALRRSPRPQAVRRYRERVRRFLARAAVTLEVDEGVFPGRAGWLKVRILRRAEEVYEALARWEVEEEDLRRLLSLVGELEGLLFDLLL
ncbi:MAG: DUF327 family protein [Brockia lithotrophica]|nr:DUF327 family protein [Brockia lithotrophica]